MTPADLLAAYDRLRVHVPTRLPPRWRAEPADPVVRLIEPSGLGHICYRALGTLSEGVSDDLILRERDHFAARGAPVEWMLHSHDRPADLAARLRAAGFAPTVDGTVMVAEVAVLARLDAELPRGLRLREVDSSADFKRIARLYREIDGDDHTIMLAGLRREQRDLPDSVTMVVAEAPSGEVVSAGWARFIDGSGFVTLWGGATAEPWRRRGIYRALVAHRARLAAERGYRHIQVTASPASRPILARMGMAAVAVAMPHRWTPAEPA